MTYDNMSVVPFPHSYSAVRDGIRKPLLFWLPPCYSTSHAPPDQQVHTGGPTPTLPTPTPPTPPPSKASGGMDIDITCKPLKSNQIDWDCIFVSSPALELTGIFATKTSKSICSSPWIRFRSRLLGCLRSLCRCAALLADTRCLLAAGRELSTPARRAGPRNIRQRNSFVC